MFVLPSIKIAAVLDSTFVRYAMLRLCLTGIATLRLFPPSYLLVMYTSRFLLDNETLDLVLHLPDLSCKLRGIVGGDAGSNDGARDTTSASERGFGWDVDVCYVLVFAEEGKVEEDGEWAGVGGENDDLGDTSVEGLVAS